MGSDEHTQTAVSPALAAAQAKLFRLRQVHSAELFPQGAALVWGDHGRFPPPPSLSNHINELPPHLGWESAPVTAVLRQPATSPDKTPPVFIKRKLVLSAAEVDAKTQREKPEKRAAFVKVYPSVAQGMLREGQAAAGRVWLLLRYLDENGRGWLTESDAQKQLTTKTSSTYIFGKRQWRNIVKKGNSLFWRRENGRLWLNSVSKTAAALGVWQLNGRPVQLPVSVLTEKIGTVRAHLYATFHSSRTVARLGSRPQPKPIARDSLAAQFNITPHTQRSYERKARVKSHQNYALGKKESTENTESAAWQHGTAAFSFTDYLGKHGRPGKMYLAWQLPNHYFGPHQQACRGQQKRINRELADLFMKGMTGNDNEPIDGKNKSTAEARRTQRKTEESFAPLRLKNIPRRFCGNGRSAAKVYNQNQAKQDVYWRGKAIWHVLEKD